MKNERGSITVITLVTILFMLAFLISTYSIIANRRQAQAEIKAETRKIYGTEVDNVEEIYNSYLAKVNEEIPIRTAEELFKIGTGESIFANNKIYVCSKDANYKLDNDITFDVADYAETIKTEKTEENEKKWVTIEKQKTNGTLTGTFSYNGHTITETDTGNNVIIHEEK